MNVFNKINLSFMFYMINVSVPGKYRPDQYHLAKLDRYKTYGKIWKETICGKTIVHLVDPEYIKEMYSKDGRFPHAPVFREASHHYREKREMSLGLGNL